MFLVQSLLYAASLIYSVAADVGVVQGQDLFSYKSRPDLKPPKWNITYYDRDSVAPGFFFVGPYNFQNNHPDDVKWVACEVGPTIYDSDGELVWSGACQFHNRIFQDFRIQPFWEPGGIALTGTINSGRGDEPGHRLDGFFIGPDYQIQYVIPLDEFHEFEVVRDNWSILGSLGGYPPLPESAYRDGQQNNLTLERTGFQMRDLHTGTVLFEWVTHEHVDVDESTMDRPKMEGAEFKPFHLNAVDRTKDGHFLVSLRHASLILLVDGTDGHIIWRAGGKKSDFRMLDGLIWSRQHHARVRERDENRTVISFLDNAWTDQKGDPGPTNDFSRGLLVELNHEPGGDWTARMIQDYKRPDRGYSVKRGSFQQLDNGNVFMCWTDGGFISEHTKDDRLLMEAHWLRHDRFDTYRGFKFDNWVGRPIEPPIAVGEIIGGDNASGSGGTTVTTMYVSWNGATEVRSWRFWGGPELLGTVEKHGFETSFSVVGDIRVFHVEAIGADGTVMGRTTPTWSHTPTGIGAPSQGFMAWLETTQHRLAARYTLLMPSFIFFVFAGGLWAGWKRGPIFKVLWAEKALRRGAYQRIASSWDSMSLLNNPA